MELPQLRRLADNFPEADRVKKLLVGAQRMFTDIEDVKMVFLMDLAPFDTGSIDQMRRKLEQTDCVCTHFKL